MKTRPDFRLFRQRALSIALAASVIPSLALVWYSYRQAVTRAKTTLTSVANTVRKRTDGLLNDTDTTLRRLAADTDGMPPAAAARMLRRTVFANLPYRGAALINNQGKSITTSQGRLAEPIKLSPERLVDRRDQNMQVLGRARTGETGEESIVLALPTRTGGQVNVLVHPSFFTLFLDEETFGVEGFVVVRDTKGVVLASAGDAPLKDNRLPPAPGGEQWRVEEKTARADLSITTGVAPAWALRYWKEDMQLIAPLLLLYNLGLTLAVMRLVRQSEGLESDLQAGLRRREFEVRYLPVVDMRTGVCVGAEALLRWRHPTQGLLPPLRFIATAEETGIIAPLTEWLLGQIMREQAPLLRRFPDLYVTVNVAPSHLAQDGFHERFTALARALKLPPQNFVLEITERGLLEDSVTTVPDTMTFLRRDGLRWALDDFGTGYSSLSYLHRFPFDQLKIDRAFVRGIGEQTGAALSVLDALIDLGQKLNLTIVAEGVEKDVQREYLQERGVEFAQGWLYCQPVTIEEFTDFVSRTRSKGGE